MPWNVNAEMAAEMALVTWVTSLGEEMHQLPGLEVMLLVVSCLGREVEGCPWSALVGAAPEGASPLAMILVSVLASLAALPLECGAQSLVSEVWETSVSLPV